MKYLIPVVLLIMLSLRLPAQVMAKDERKVTLSHKEEPAFPGGTKELRKYLSLNLRYPNKAIENKVQGEVVVSFIIDEQGNIQDVQTVKSIGYGCDEEAMRVIKAMPQWQPAVQKGKSIRVNYTLPVVFELPYQPNSIGN